MIQEINFLLEPQKIHCLIGESGSGKTTLLRLMNGMIAPDRGRIDIAGDSNFEKNWVELRRKMGYVIQGSGLFPHLTVVENISLIGRRLKMPDDAIEKRCKELLNLVNMPFEQYASKRPRQLSGGQQQRVGIARALFMNPSIILMDEPFGALDPLTRQEIQEEFLKMQKEFKFTAVVVTHDLSEAFRLADNILLLNRGKIEQQGRPSRLLRQPASVYTREFLTSHSPAKILQSIRLYAIASNNLLLTSRVADPGNTDSFIVKNLMNSEETRIETLNNLIDFHQDRGQKDIFFCKRDFSSDEVQRIDGGSKLIKIELPELGANEGFDTALDILLNDPKTEILVTNPDKSIVGIINREVVDALV